MATSTHSAAAWHRASCAAVALTVALVLQGCGGGGGGGGGGGWGGSTGTCGSKSPSPEADCQNVDFGSCGNACCNLIVTSDKSPDDIVKALQANVASSNLATQFELQDLAEGTKGFANLSMASAKLPAPFKGSKSIWIGQVHHETSGAKHYIDTINFNMRSGPKGGSIVRAFSLSLVGGAFGDNGQNFKNIKMLMNGLDYKVTEHLNNSCPDAAHFEQKALRAVEKALPAVQTSRRLSSEGDEAAPEPSVTQKASEVGSCGGDSPSKVADCQNVDFGSCGNACCGLLIHSAYDPARAMQKINESLSSGGPDGGYSLQTTAGGSIGFDNLTEYVDKLPAPYNKSKLGVYIGQVHHMTSGPKHYNDTISFTFYKTNDEVGSYVHAHSVSLIGGALGDNGQNYKNILMAIRAAFGNYHVVKDSYFGSCPAAPAPTPGPAPGPAPTPPSTCKGKVLPKVNCDDDKNMKNKPVKSQDECCSFCMETKGCAAWTWNADKKLDPAQNCYLKTDCKSQKAKDGVISGKINGVVV